MHASPCSITHATPRSRDAGLRLPSRASFASARRDRSGVALVLFALLVFGFMGIMAVAIDVAMASLTQAQMQNAVDTGAIEAVRMRDAEPHVHSDMTRRLRASALVQMVFDDDLHPTSGVIGTIEPESLGGLAPMAADDPDSLKLGAGPIWSLTPGPDASNVGEGYDDHPDVYDDPVLQTNPTNLPNGDMISGTYSWGASHAENPDDYTRADFDPAPSVGFDSTKPIGFLVRMRRTKVVGAPDQQPGVSSGGPPLPFLFGLGSTIREQDPPDPQHPYNPRTDGITVRAAAIACARPAMTIGPPPDMPNRVGDPMQGLGFWYDSAGTPSVRMLAPPLALSQDFWANSLDLHADDKQLSESGGLLSYNGQVVGSFLVPNGGSTVGVPIQTGPAPLNVPSVKHYISVFPIYTSVLNAFGAATNRVAGFGYGRVWYDSTTLEWTISKGLQNLDIHLVPTGYCAMYVAPDNASARPSPAAPTLSPVEWTNIFTAYNRFGYTTSDPDVLSAHLFDWQYIREGTVLAPVLVR